MCPSIRIEMLLGDAVLDLVGPAPNQVQDEFDCLNLNIAAPKGLFDRELAALVRSKVVRLSLKQTPIDMRRLPVWLNRNRSSKSRGLRQLSIKLFRIFCAQTNFGSVEESREWMRELWSPRSTCCIRVGSKEHRCFW